MVKKVNHLVPRIEFFTLLHRTFAGFPSILVVVDGCSRAQTNRPQISTYLMNQYVHGKKPLPLIDEPALQFNAYKIAADQCYRARKIEIL